MKLYIHVINAVLVILTLWAIGTYIYIVEATEYGIAIERTAQIQIQESEQTNRVQIHWDALTEIERIRADVSKKTDVTFVLFWLVRAVLWVGGIVVALLAGALVLGGGRRA